MYDFHTVSGAAKMFADFLGNHDGAVLASGAAESDRQVTLSFVNVVRQQEKQIRNGARDELPGLGKRTDIFRDTGIPPRERSELRDEMRIRQKAHIGHHVGVLWKALPESEANTGNEQVLLRGLFLKALSDVSAQFVDIELGSIDHEVGHGTDCTQVTAFCLKSRLHRRVGAQRVRAACLTEAPHENGIGSLEEDDFGRDHARDGLQDPGKFFQLGAFAHVHDQRGAANLTGLDSQVGELRDELYREVVDTVVAEIFKGL